MGRTNAEDRVRTAFRTGDGAQRSNPAIARELGVPLRMVRRVRTELGLPQFARGRRAEHDSLADAVTARLVLRKDGHTAWGGPCHDTYLTPLVNFAGVTRSVARFLFEEHHGRPPVGYVKSSCGEAHCLTREHLADAAMRKDSGR